MITIECDICDNQIADNQDYFIIRDKSQWEKATIKVSLYVHKECWNQVITNSMNFINLQKAYQKGRMTLMNKPEQDALFKQVNDDLTSIQAFVLMKVDNVIEARKLIQAIMGYGHKAWNHGYVKGSSKDE